MQDDNFRSDHDLDLMSNFQVDLQGQIVVNLMRLDERNTMSDKRKRLHWALARAKHESKVIAEKLFPQNRL